MSETVFEYVCDQPSNDGVVLKIPHGAKILGVKMGRKPVVFAMVSAEQFGKGSVDRRFFFYQSDHGIKAKEGKRMKYIDTLTLGDGYCHVFEEVDY